MPLESLSFHFLSLSVCIIRPNSYSRNERNRFYLGWTPFIRELIFRLDVIKIFPLGVVVNIQDSYHLVLCLGPLLSAHYYDFSTPNDAMLSHAKWCHVFSDFRRFVTSNMCCNMFFSNPCCLGD